MAGDLVVIAICLAFWTTVLRSAYRALLWVTRQATASRDTPPESVPAQSGVRLRVQERTYNGNDWLWKDFG